MATTVVRRRVLLAAVLGLALLIGIIYATAGGEDPGAEVLGASVTNPQPDDVALFCGLTVIDGVQACWGPEGAPLPAEIQPAVLPLFHFGCYITFGGDQYCSDLTPSTHSVQDLTIVERTELAAVLSDPAALSTAGLSLAAVDWTSYVRDSRSHGEAGAEDCYVEFQDGRDGTRCLDAEAASLAADALYGQVPQSFRALCVENTTDGPPHCGPSFAYYGPRDIRDVQELGAHQVCLVSGDETTTYYCHTGPNFLLLEAEIPEDVQYLMDTYNVDEEEARRRLAIQWHLPGLVPQMMALSPTGFGGAYVDHADNGIIAVQVAGDSEEIEGFLISSEIEGLEAAEFRFHAAEFSYATLLGVHDRLVADRSTLSANGIDLVRVRVNVIGNSVDIFAAGLTNSQRQQLVNTYGPSITFLASIPEYQDEECARLSCSPPLRGGPGMSLSNGAFNCSAGFNAGVVNGGTNRVLLMAGHCNDSNRWMALPQSEWPSYDDYVRDRSPAAIDCDANDSNRSLSNCRGSLGNMTEETGTAGNGTPADAQYNELNYHGWWNPSRWVWHNHAAQSLAITHKNPTAANTLPGFVICRSGRNNTSAKCGEVVTPVSTEEREGNQSQLVAHVCSQVGDSGGPWYTRNDTTAYLEIFGSRVPAITYPQGMAFGIHNGGQTGGCDSTREAFASHVEFVEAELNVFIWCGGPAVPDGNPADLGGCNYR